MRRLIAFLTEYFDFAWALAGTCLCFLVLIAILFPQVLPWFGGAR